MKLFIPTNLKNNCSTVFFSYWSKYTYGYKSLSGGNTKTRSWRGWESDEWVQKYALQIYGRSTNRPHKCKVVLYFLVSFDYLLVMLNWK